MSSAEAPPTSGASQPELPTSSSATQPATTSAPTPTSQLHPSDPRLPYPFSNPSTTPPTLIAQGAEALLYRTHYLTPSQPAALKVRPSKKYRHKILDERLTKQRVLAEARVLVRLAGVDDSKGGWRVPGVLGVEWDVGQKVKGLRAVRVAGDEGEGGAWPTTGEVQKKEGDGGAWLLMEWVDGMSVKELVRRWDAWIREGDEAGNELRTEEERQQGEEELKALLRRIGRAVAGMHSKGGVVHGDLTSSNLLVRKVGFQAAPGNTKPEDTRNTEGRISKPDLSGEIVLIDFGLATQSVQDEDRAVDLYVLERAFGSTHPRQEQWFDQEVLQSQDGYRGAWKGSAVVLKRLEEVRLRGRKRSMIG